MRTAVISFHSSPLHEPGSGDAGGMTVYVRELARSLATRGVETDIFTRATAPDESVVTVYPGVRVVPIAAGPQAILSKEEGSAHLDVFADGIVRFASEEGIDYDLVHSHYWQSGLAGLRLARRWDVPLVHSHHTLGRVKNRFLAPGDEAEPAARLEGEDDVIAGADVLIASTPEEYEQLGSLYGAPAERLKILPPGVDHTVFHPGDREASRRRLGLGDGALVLYVGRIQRLKGIELGLRAFEQLVHALERPVRFLVVGGASGFNGEQEENRLRELARRLDIESNVGFLGPRHHEELPDFYRAADAVVVSSYSESFGFAALEAHACGTPVVATAVGGLSHIVRDGESGWLVGSRDETEFAARLKSILGDEVLWSRFSECAQDVAAMFSWDRTADDLLSLYECLIRERVPEICTCGN
jgi:D-inositol-3-phosphate glycosyltransferase